MAFAPNLTAGISSNVPQNVPIAVRTGSAITTECSEFVEKLQQRRQDQRLDAVQVSRLRQGGTRNNRYSLSEWNHSKRRREQRRRRQRAQHRQPDPHRSQFSSTQAQAGAICT